MSFPELLDVWYDGMIDPEAPASSYMADSSQIGCMMGSTDFISGYQKNERLRLRRLER